MLNTPANEWMPESRLVMDLTLEYAFRVTDTFYTGPDNGATPEQWRDERVPLHQPNIPKFKDRWVLSKDVIGHEHDLLEHYQDVVRQAEQHRKRLDESSHFWNRPAMFGAGVQVRFPWADTFQESKPLLERLGRDEPGGVFSDLDQGWALDIVIADGFLHAWDRDWENGRTLCNIKTPFEPICQQALGLLPRVEHLIGFLRRELRQPHWF